MLRDALKLLPPLHRAILQNGTEQGGKQLANDIYLRYILYDSYISYILYHIYTFSLWPLPRSCTEQVADFGTQLSLKQLTPKNMRIDWTHRI